MPISNVALLTNPVAGPGPGPVRRLAVIANYGDRCGIATYTGFLVDALIAGGQLDALKVFAEGPAPPSPAPTCFEPVASRARATRFEVEPCWLRGQAMGGCAAAVLAWEPDAVLIQHEFGLFPRATWWLQLLQRLDRVRHAVVLHSVYEHRDKAVCSGGVRHAICHSEAGRDCLRRLGHSGRVDVIPHGCVRFDDVAEHWNIYQTPYALMQFGFGFRYKGVERALEAIAILKDRQPEKYAASDPAGGDRKLFYTYLCSESPHVRNVIGAHYDELVARAEALGVEDNVAIIRGYQTEEMLCHYLRTNKLALFPYVTDPANVVYGASGAIRVAMANGIPVIASDSPMFADLAGVVPRPGTAEDLATEIDRVFSSAGYRDALVGRATAYVRSHTWDQVAARYLEVLADSPAPDRRPRMARL